MHGEEVFRALGEYRQRPVEHVVAVADLYKNSNRGSLRSSAAIPSR